MGYIKYNKDFFEKGFANFDEVMGNPWGMNWRATHKKRFKEIMELLGEIKKPQKVLEIACASGDFTEILYQSYKDIELVGVDISDIAIDICRKRFKDNKNLKFEQAELPILNFPDQSFDTILCVDVLCYLNYAKKRKALFNIERILKKDGKVILMIPYKKDEVKFLKKELKKFFKVKKVKYNYNSIYTKIEKGLLKIYNKFPTNKSLKKFLFKIISSEKLMYKFANFNEKYFRGEKGRAHILLLLEKRKVADEK